MVLIYVKESGIDFISVEKQLVEVMSWSTAK